MKLNLKSLTGKMYDIEVDDNSTVTELKQKIEEQYSFPVSQQNLVFTGKVLIDSQTLIEAGMVLLVCFC
jgi:hypothetical protein